MTVQHGVDVGPRLVDLGMDEALRIDRAIALVERLAVEIELHNVGPADTARRERRRHQKTVLALGMADADVAEAVDHALAVEDAIGSDQVVDYSAQIRWRLRPRGWKRPGAKRRERGQRWPSERHAGAANSSTHHHLRIESAGLLDPGRDRAGEHNGSPRPFLFPACRRVSSHQRLEATSPPMAG